MSDHEFEKQVRQKLNDLKLSPTSKAWENIENSIRGRKRRLAPVFWLSVLLVGLGAGGYYLWQPSPSSEMVVQKNNNANESTSTQSDQRLQPDQQVSPDGSFDSQPRNNSSGQIRAGETPANSPGHDAGTSRSTPEETDRRTQERAVVRQPDLVEGTVSDRNKNIIPPANSAAERESRPTDNKPADNLSRKAGGQPAQSRGRQADLEPTENQGRKADGEPKENEVREAYDNSKEGGEPDDKAVEGGQPDNKAGVAPTSPATGNRRPNPDAAVTTVTSPVAPQKTAAPGQPETVAIKPGTAATAEPESATTTEENPATPTIPVTQKPAITKKWSFGVQGSGGISAINEGKLISFSGASQVEDIAMLPMFAAPARLPNPAPPPSQLYSGPMFSAGLTVKRELSPRVSVSAGINYLQINSRTEVGYKVARSQVVNSYAGFLEVQNYYLPTNSPLNTATRVANKYDNRYHFVEVPVTMHFQLNRSQKVPVHWNAGASVAQLLSSNSLHYDGTNGVYYRNDDFLNQLQAAVHTGFSVSLFNRSGRPLWIGPMARYNLTRVLQKEAPSTKNFMGVGLDVKWFFR